MSVAFIGPECDIKSREVQVTKTLCSVFAVLTAIPCAVLAQTPAAAPSNPITASEKGVYGFVSGTVIAAAEKMPEENYSFKPTPDVRSFGQLVGHVADSQGFFCATAAGETPTPKNIEKTKTSKADLVAALKDAQAACNKTFDAMTDATGSQMVKLMNFNMAKLTVLSVNTAHTDEHYGNMVTYLRLKGIVPPSSEKRPAPDQKSSSGK
jgi:uncharacterized damage-inducible protein DinB